MFLLCSGLTVAHAQSSASSPTPVPASAAAPASTPAPAPATSATGTGASAMAPAANSGAQGAPPAPPVAPPATRQPQLTSVANPYGLGALWAHGDFVARGTLLILVIMSMSSWYVLITKAFAQSRLFRDGKAIDAGFWNAGSVRLATETMKKGTAFHYVAQTGVDSLDKHPGLLGKIDLHSFATSSIEDGVAGVQSRLQDGLALLGTVGSTAPFVGLFGTVWGIYHALTAIGIAGQASIDKVAGPVGEALIMTAIGLAVAVPAVLGYNFLVRRNKRSMDLVRKFAKKMLFVLLIIFLITIPVVTHTVPVHLPHEKNQPLQTKPENINISVDRKGAIYWNQQLLPDVATLRADMIKIARENPQPAVVIRGDENAQYKSVGRILFICQQVGITKVNFVTDPTGTNAGS
ncbi:MotA/TolQ/ExbB proton channel family protein [Acidiphilium sp. 20-67-58]|nr:MotA/TolQ/ExbB proton channel family protein [Acidiphilium sp. 20-67-58]